jgi:hypothetical protein
MLPVNGVGNPEIDRVVDKIFVEISRQLLHPVPVHYILLLPPIRRIADQQGTAA